MTVAEELIQEGRELGRKEAMNAAQELIQEGREQGRQQAMTAAEELVHQNKVKFIRAMLKLNLDSTAISSAAELPIIEVDAIIEEINRMHAS